MEHLQVIEREGGDVIPLREPETEQLKPRVFIASVGDYEQYDRVHGRWLDATADVVELEEGAREVVRTSRSGSPLWGVYEAEGFYGLDLDAEWQDLRYVSALARGIAAHGEAFMRWSQVVAAIEDLEQFEQRYVGQFETGADYAQHLAGELGVEETLSAVPEGLRPFVRFDAEAYAKHLIDTDCVAVTPAKDGVHIFTL